MRARVPDIFTSLLKKFTINFVTDICKNIHARDTGFATIDHKRDVERMRRKRRRRRTRRGV